MNDTNQKEFKKAIELEDSSFYIPPQEYRLWNTQEELDSDQENYEYWLEEEMMKPESYLRKKYGDDPNEWPGAPYDPTIM